MGVCFSKREPSSPTKAPTLKEKSTLNEEKKKETASAEREPVSSAAAAFLTAKKASCAAEEKDKKKGETPLNKSFQLEREKGYKSVASDEQRPAPLRTSSCTKEELDAILIQCGRLSRSSSDKISDEMTIAGGQGRYSGSKRSYDFDNERRKEEEEEEEANKLTSRPSPRRRTRSRERSGSRERGSNNGRRLSQSPGRRLDGPPSASGCDKLKPQPAKMVSVPAREKDAPFVKGENDGRSLAITKVSAATSTGGLRSASRRSRSPNTARMSSENPQPQSLSRNSSRKAEHSPYRRNPMAEIHENSLKQNEGCKEVEDGARKPIHSLIHAKEDQAKKVDIAVDAKASIGNLTRTRRPSKDLDNNQGFNTTSYASIFLEDIKQQQQNKVISLPACVSKACSIVEAIANLNSYSEHRSYEADQSSNNSSLRGGGLLVKEIEVKDDLMEPSLQKYVTVRNMERDVGPQESAGSNSFVGQRRDSTWELDSVDSADGCGASLSGNCNEREVELENEISPAGNYQQQRLRLEPDGQESRALSGSKSLTAAAGTGLGKEFDCRRRGGHGVGEGNGKIGERTLSLPVSVASF